MTTHGNQLPAASDTESESEYGKRCYDWNAQVRLAVWQVDRPKLEELLRIETRWNLNIPGGDDGETILHEVCASPGDRVDIAQMLIDCGADVNACNLDGEQSLHAACLAGNAGVARLLLAHKANCYARDCDERVPLAFACNWLHVEEARVLLDAGFDVTYEDSTSGDGPLHWVFQVENLDRKKDSALLMVALFLDSGANVNAQNIGGETALHLACYTGSEQLVALLLQRGADASSTVTTLSHRTALHYAVLVRERHATRFLCLYGADTNARDSLGLNSLHLLFRRLPQYFDYQDFDIFTTLILFLMPM